MLNATWLETFTTLCEIGHFTRAAERLNMTQPGVSQQLRKLEAQVGQPLIAQDGKRFTLTPAGEAVFALGRSRRAEEQRLRENIARDDPDAGLVRVACSGSFALLLYPRVLDRLTEAPALSVQVEAAPQRSVEQGVLDGRFDLGVLGRDPNHPRLNATRIGTEELCLVLPLGAKGTKVTFDDLQSRGLVAHPDVDAYANDFLALNFPDQFVGADRLRTRTRINQIGQIPEPVARGIGYTLLPRSGIEGFAQKDSLWIAPLPERRHHALWLVSRRAPPSARVRRIANLCREVAERLR
ncbi:LysR family transcriptional regulator [Mameliella alba]|nr:LysR family transcriptional regulator [Antarctobacter heliothermus]MBY6142841.1 LysR family transcriptional regulator [Mameliella alba]MCA0953434.1 LysR family transcriptional regulator [Mameliella alba]